MRLALTATAAPPVRQEIITRPGLRDPEVVIGDFDRPNIELSAYQARSAGDEQRELVRSASDLVRAASELAAAGEQATTDHARAGRGGRIRRRRRGSGVARLWFLPKDIAGARPPGWVRVGKKVVPVDLSREQFIKLLRHAGLTDVAEAAETELPAHTDAKILSAFCTAHGVSVSMLTDRMGSGP